MKLENFCCTYAPGAERLSDGGCAPIALPSWRRAEQIQLLPAFLGTSGIDEEKLEKLRFALNCTHNWPSSQGCCSATSLRCLCWIKVCPNGYAR